MVFGNPEFFRYNVAGTLQPLRILLALLIRLWQTFGYFHLLLLTAGDIVRHVASASLSQDHKRDLEAGPDRERPRIALNSQLAMLFVILAYVLAMAIVGGAELARYMLASSSAGHPDRHFDAVAQGPLVARRGGDHCADVRCRMVRQSTLWIRAGR